MHRRKLLFGALGLMLSDTVRARANVMHCGRNRFAPFLLGASNTDARRATRLTYNPALRAYVASLCPILAGTFQIGSSTGDPDEKPVHRVTLSGFRMGATPVTVAIWKEYCAATKTPLPDAPSWGLLDDHPVVNVSWNDIMGADGNGGFCAWASAVAGLPLKLPTEAQFEYAARGGQSGLEYTGGNSFDRSKLWCSEADFAEVDATASVHRSSKFFRNAYGLSDMSGSVWQWCLDLYCPYTTSSQNDSNGPSSTSDEQRCLRGGAWLAEWYDKEFRDPNWRGSFTGFRLSAEPG